MKTKQIASLLIISGSLFILACKHEVKYSTNGFTNKADAINSVTDSGKEGKWIEYSDINDDSISDSSKAVYYTLTIYKMGKKFGTVRQYFKSGVIRNEWTYTNGQISGLSKEYDENGKLKSEYPYSGGKIDGVAKLYYAGGKVSAERTFKNGNEMAEKRYFENGKVSADITYINGFPGEVKMYDTTGTEIIH